MESKSEVRVMSRSKPKRLNTFKNNDMSILDGSPLGKNLNIHHC